MTEIEIVAHCWRYWGVEAYQMSSLVLHPPQECKPVLSIFYSPDDPLAMDYLMPFLTEHLRGILRAWPIPTEMLLNRAIGRNMAAKETRADVVWFTDADYLFGPGCLDALAKQGIPDRAEKLFFPQTTLMNNDHATGDRYALAAEPAKVLDIDQVDFRKENAPNRAIGGIQIVSGDTARNFGYCPDAEKHHRKVHGSTFKRNRSDKTYRRQLGDGRGHRIDLPGLFRIRQTTMGQVDTLTSTKSP